jgi:hypothetical protein
MTSFKAYINEATLEELQNKGFGIPGERAKHQVGDYVVVISDSRWGSYQPNRSSKYIGHAGKVVGYKQVPGSYVKYAVEFPDKNVETFHSHYIIGPFADLNTANKYSIQKIKSKKGLIDGLAYHSPKVNVADLRNYQGGVLQSNANYESKLLNILTKQPFNLAVPNKPIKIVGGSNSQYVATVLAYRPFDSHGIKFLPNKHTRNGKIYDNKTSDFQNFIIKNITLYRLNNSITGKFVSDSHGSHTSLSKEYDYVNSPYFLAIPFVDFRDINYSDIPVDFFDKEFLKKQVKGNEKNNRGLIEIKDISLPQRVLKDVDLLAETVKRFDDLATGNFDSQALFDKQYAITEDKGKKYLNSDAKVDENTIKYFYDLHTLEGKNVYQDVRLSIYTTNPARLKGKIPPNITKLTFVTPGYNRYPYGNMGGKLTTANDCTFLNNSNAVDIEFDGFDINSFDGTPSTVKFVRINYSKVNNLNGIPKRVNVISLNRCKVNSLEGGADIVVNDLEVYDTTLTNKNTLNQIPESKQGYGSVRIDGIREDQIKKVIKDRKFLKNLKPNTQKAFGDIFTSI